MIQPRKKKKKEFWIRVRNKTKLLDFTRYLIHVFETPAIFSRKKNAKTRWNRTIQPILLHSVLGKSMFATHNVSINSLVHVHWDFCISVFQSEMSQASPWTLVSVSHKTVLQNCISPNYIKSLLYHIIPTISHALMCTHVSNRRLWVGKHCLLDQ